MNSLTGIAEIASSEDLQPAGFIDLINDVEVVGWLYIRAGDRRTPVVLISIDGGPPTLVHADVYRADVVSAGHQNGDVGFHFSVPERYRDQKEHVVAFYDRNGDPLPLRRALTHTVATEFGFTSGVPAAEPTALAVAGQRVVVNMDMITEDGVKGWGYDESTPLVPTCIIVLIDGVPSETTVCDIEREDVRRSGHPSAAVGFCVPIPGKFFDDKEHQVRFKTKDDRSVFLVGADAYAERGPCFRLPSTKIIGQVDGLQHGAIRGWVIRHDRRTGQRSGSLTILVTQQRQPVAQFVANQFRADVADAFGVTPNCGFVYVPPRDLVTSRTVEFSFRVMPGGFELDNSPYVATFPAEDTYRKIRELSAVADSLYTQLWSLRAQIKGMLPAEQFDLTSYDRWARQYFARLAVTPALSLPPAYRDAPPLVSIICPSYRPRMKDFVAAVESIIGQTYTNWELIIVDDASKSEELSDCIEAFAQRDSRIRYKLMHENGGISVATNTALAMARGHFIALFDHDDMMVGRAIEYMVEAALRTGAKFLYCDEDKIDDEGIYSEVNLKPDFNYRLLLAQNYICHILFVERALLEQAGPLRKVCDGAQDHDLIIRLAELTPPAQIHHVPEILYHWRKTPFSTAGSGKAKSYTVVAGIRAIADHLERKGLEGEVRSPLQITVYDIAWKLPREPKVTIIIPYREHVGMTTECLDALRSVTDYANFEIVLVDNWSTSDDALAFAARQAAMPATRVIRVEEKFNYSRINNIAVAATEGEFLLFLNNDVVVRDRGWLTQMMGEALADPKVGVVGNKLLYPNGLVQHGGIILGVGGVADHAHRGLTEGEPGYMARAICAQDMSAVTAACLLCRREAFDKAGGFDEANLHVAFNDVDLCLKVGMAGYRLVWTPASVAEHRESLSRGNDFKPEHQARFFGENTIMEARWPRLLSNDPHYNRNFSRQSGIFKDLCSIQAV